MATTLATLERTRIIKSLKIEIRSLDLAPCLKGAKRLVNKNALCILFNEPRSLLTDYAPAFLADLLTQASGVQIATNFIKAPVKITR